MGRGIRKLFLFKLYRHRPQTVPIYFAFKFQTQHVPFVYPSEAAIFGRKTVERYRVSAARNNVRLASTKFKRKGSGARGRHKKRP
jgi:hypothetical protein